jgi:hypothetical protein
VSALSDAMQPFWASLSEDQKRLAPVLLRHGRGEGRRMRMGMHRGGRGDHHGWGHYRGHHGGGYPVRWHHGGRGMMDDGPRGR